MANTVSYLSLLKMLSQKYRLIAFDNMGWGLNTRIPEYFADCDDLEKAEAWILDFYE